MKYPETACLLIDGMGVSVHFMAILLKNMGFFVRDGVGSASNKVGNTFNPIFLSILKKLKDCTHENV